MPESRSPVVYPTVELNGRLLVVKCDLYAQYLMSDKGLNPVALVKQSATDRSYSIANMVKLWAAMVAHNFVKAKEVAPSAEEWAALIPEDKWGECCTAISQAIVKVLRPAVPAQATVAETAANLVEIPQ